MKKLLLIIPILIVTVFFFWPENDWKKINYPPKGSKVVAFGDSLVEGYGGEPGGFITKLSERLGIDIINLGVSGDTTDSALKRIGEVIKEEPDVVIILLGGNDFLRGLPKDRTFVNLSIITRRFEEIGATVLILGVRGGLLTDSYEEDYEEFARKHGTFYLSNVLDGLLGKNKYMFDQIHPNDLGYEKIADRVEPVLRKILNL